MKQNYFMVGFAFLIFFVISFLTNILGPMIPDIIESFNLSLTMAGYLPFSFFIAYGVMFIPARILVEKYGEKPIIIISFCLSFIGSLMFAMFPNFNVTLCSLFLIGISIAMLHAAINPLLPVAGGENHFAIYSMIIPFAFGTASCISPQVYSYLVTHLKTPTGQVNVFVSTLANVVPPQIPWISLYWVFTVVTILMVILMLLIRLPKVPRKDDEKAGTWKTHVMLFKYKNVLLYFIGIMAYVGSQQGVVIWVSQFLKRYHGFDPKIQGADAVSYFWSMFTVGFLLGLLLLKLFDNRKILIVFSSAAMISLTFAIFGPANVAYYAFAIVGFFVSVMWWIIFSLALNSVPRHHGSFSGILCTAIIGGAVVPLIVGWLGDLIGLRLGMTFLYITLGYILSIGFWAKPLIKNTVIKKQKT
jgi:MFS transporter, FHS family, L-fucose permease